MQTAESRARIQPRPSPPGGRNPFGLAVLLPHLCPESDGVAHEGGGGGPSSGCGRGVVRRGRHLRQRRPSRAPRRPRSPHPAAVP